MSAKPSERRVIMAKKLAKEWLTSRASVEFRFRVFHNQDCANYMNLLRAFRDGHRKIGGVDPLPDLGLKHELGGFTVWASDYQALSTLKKFFVSKGMDTSWIW